MKIQSLSVCVPGDKCINDCLCCVSKMNAANKIYKNQLENNVAFYDLYLNDFMKRLEFCRSNGCNTVMLTGSVEPQQNMSFLRDFGIMLRLMKDPFPIIEMQTTGATINEEKLRFFRNHIGISTISLSLFSFDEMENQDCRNSNLEVDITNICHLIKKYDFNLRLSLNLTKHFEQAVPIILDTCKKLGADQITFRRLYDADDGSPESEWTKRNEISRIADNQLLNYLQNFPVIRRLETNNIVRSIDGMSVSFDGDCMDKRNEDISDSFKYLIVRPNGKLYSAWDDPASLIF